MESRITIRWLKRIGIGLLSLVVFVFLALAGVILFGELFGSSSRPLTNVGYENAEGLELRGYLAMPQGEGPFPAVLMIHEWWGLNEEITVLADALASEGYIVLAADAYRGELTESVPRALWMRLITPEERIFNDLDRALEYLGELDSVKSGRVASLGFCFGGEHSLQLSLRKTELLAATVMYYGAVVTNPDALRPLVVDQPLLGIFGEEDTNIPVEEVRQFEAALDSLGVENRILIYDGVGHAFLTAENYSEPGPANEAWNETLAFLENHLKQNHD